MSSNGLVLVTGVTGFLGSHVVDQLIHIGYRVRGTTRSNKLLQVKQGFARYGNMFQMAVIDDLATGDYKDALEGVQAVIHVAAPQPGTIEPKIVLEATIAGVLNLLCQAEKAGVQKFALASSIATAGVMHPNGQLELSEKVWTAVDKAAALGEAGNKDPLMVYQTAKTLAERAAWDFVEQHPHVEFTSINPPILYGPLAPGYRNPDAKISALSSNSFLYDLLRRDGPAPISPAYLDVRDAARALVNALDSAPTAEVGPKRIVLSGEWFSAKDAVEYIAQSRPELADRLSDAAKSAPPAPPTPVDNTRAKEILKLEITDWKVSVIDGVDDLLKLEAEWKAKGLTPK